jgi:hypothetical protein
MEYIYRKENIDFKKRIRKHIPMIFIFSFLFIAVYLSIQHEKFGLYDFGIISSFPILLILVTILGSRNNIYEIRINEQTIHIFGTKYNDKWNTIFQVEKIKIKIIESRAKSRHVLGYIIEFRSAEQCYKINEQFDWNNFVLYQLFTTFKKIKCEKTTLYELRLLDKLEKKAHDNYEWEY